MRILLINDSCKEGGGAETYIFAVSKLLGRNHKVALFGYEDNSITEENKVIVAYPSNKLKKSLGKFVFNFRVYSMLKKFIKQFNPNVVFMHNNYVHSIPVLLALSASKVPVVQTIHDWGQICPSSWCVIKKSLKPCEGVEGIALKCMLKGCIKPLHFFMAYPRNKLRIKLTKRIIQQFISPSKMLAADLRKHGFRNVQCIHNFMEFGNSKMNFAKSQKGLVLYAGLLSRNKGVDFLIRAFKEVLIHYPSAHLRIVGDGPERKNLESLAKELGLTNKIEFTGKIPHSKILNEFEKCRVFAIPSVWMENSPFVIYECMSVGRPIVGSARGGIMDLVLDEKTGILVEPANSEALANAILKILKDNKLAEVFSANAFHYVHSKLNSKLHIKAIEKVLKEIAGK
ncbi:MAG: glycosyltransferase family 4 protein [Candidatus Nanoarchaeia archaeon]|jgi:glycosyltransferase involved in cell wall biosynthesis